MEKRKIKLSGVIELIDNGSKRPEIQEYYGLTGREMQALFQHPLLKNRRAKKTEELSFELVEDLEEEEVVQEVVEEEAPVELAVEVEEAPVVEEVPGYVAGFDPIQEEAPVAVEEPVVDPIPDEEPININNLPTSIWK